VSIGLDIDNQIGLLGPETTNFRGLEGGIFEVWIDHYTNTFTRENVGATPATVDVFCFACLNSAGQPRSGLVSSITQTKSSVPMDGAKWWKVGEWKSPPDPGPWSAMVTLQWKTCTSNCYSDSEPGSRRSLSSLNSTLKAKQVSLPAGLQLIIRDQALEKSSVQTQGVAISAQKPAQHSVRKNRVVMLLRAGLTKSGNLARTKRANTIHKYTSASPARQRRSLLQSGTNDQWASAAMDLVQDAFDRGAYAEVNQHTGTLALEIDSRVASEMSESADSAKTKTFILEKLSASVRRAIKNENYICEVLASSQAMGANTRLLSPTAISHLSEVVKNLMKVGSIQSLTHDCMTMALAVVGNNLDATALASCPANAGTSAVASTHNTTSLDPVFVKQFVDNFESSIAHLSKKAASSLIAGQSRALFSGNVSRHTVSKFSVGALFDVTREMPAATGNSSNLTVSYRLPATLLEEVSGLQGSTELTVNIGSYHNAPVVRGYQPISPLVSLSLSRAGTEVDISNLLIKDIEVTLPVKYQKACGVSRSAGSYTNVQCMYYVNGTYSTDGCSTFRAEDGATVTCKCSHLTTFVVTETEITPTACPRNAALPEDQPDDAEAENCQCNSGYTGPNNGDCAPCASGTYKTEPGSATCTYCPSGTYSGAAATSSRDACQACAIGKWSSAEAAISVDTCQDCAKGKYSTTDAADAESLCMLCLAGKYSSNAGATSDATCLACHGDATSPAGSSFAGACRCNAGFHGANGGGCALCARGTYKAEVGAAACTPCLGSADSEFGSDEATDCLCNAGFTGLNGQQCVGCSAGKYKPVTGSAVCMACPTGSATAQAASALLIECVCLAGYTGAAGSCTACIAGKYKIEGGAAACSDCTAGKYSTALAASSDMCVQCAAGKYSATQGAPNEGTCVQCDAGTYNEQQGSSSETACILCSAGTYSSALGVQRADTCLACPSGKRSEKGSDAKEDCTEACPPGETGPDGNCVPCPAGTFKDLTGPAACKSCLENSNSTKGSAACACNAGFTESETEGVCIACSTGTYKAELGNQACTDCEAGKYSDQVSAKVCIECPVGTFSTQTAKSDDVCQSCPSNSDSVASSARCTCESGYSSSEENNNILCTACVAGTYKESAGNADCLKCAEGEYSTTIGAANANVCLKCAAGKYSSTVGAGTAEKCTDCTVGKYSTTTGAITSGVCASCGLGKYSTSKGATSEVSCISCDAGKFSVMEGANTNSTCQDCTAGKYAASAAAVCSKCVAGTYSMTEAATVVDTCIACGNNSDSAESSPSPTMCKCDPGFSGPNGGFCQPCQAGYFNLVGGSAPCQNVTSLPPALPQESPPAVTVLAPPTVKPTGGKFTGFVKISMSTVAGIVAYTTDDSTPNCQNMMSSATFSIIKSLTLKAISCSNDRTSEVISELYQIEAGPVVKVSFRIEGEVTAADIDATTNERFTALFARMFSVDVSRITSLEIKDARRRLLAVRVKLGVLADSAAGARELSTAIKSADFSSMFAEAGIPKARIGAIEVAIEGPGIEVSVITPAPAKQSSGNILGIVMGLLGAAVAIGLMVAAYLFYKKRGEDRSKGKTGSPYPRWSLSAVQEQSTASGPPLATASLLHLDERFVSRSPATPHDERFMSRSPLSPHTGVSTPLVATSLSGVAESTPSAPSAPSGGLTLQTGPPPLSSDWMSATTPPGTPPGEPPDFDFDPPNIPCENNADQYVRGELAFTKEQATAEQAKVAASFSQMLSWQQGAAGGIYPNPAVNRVFDAQPARDMRENLSTMDRGRPGQDVLQNLTQDVMHDISDISDVHAPGPGVFPPHETGRTASTRLPEGHLAMASQPGLRSFAPNVFDHTSVEQHEVKEAPSLDI